MPFSKKFPYQSTVYIYSCLLIVAPYPLHHSFLGFTVPHLLSTDHDLIPARNASLAAMHGSASGSNTRTTQRENIRLSKKEMNKAVTMLTAQCLQLGYESLRLFIVDRYEVFRSPPPSPRMH
jgi:hypothetical protein